MTRAPDNTRAAAGGLHVEVDPADLRRGLRWLGAAAGRSQPGSCSATLTGWRPQAGGDGEAGEGLLAIQVMAAHLDVAATVTLPACIRRTGRVGLLDWRQLHDWLGGLLPAPERSSPATLIALSAALTRGSWASGSVALQARGVGGQLASPPGGGPVSGQVSAQGNAAIPPRLDVAGWGGQPVRLRDPAWLADGLPRLATAAAAGQLWLRLTGRWLLAMAGDQTRLEVRSTPLAASPGRPASSLPVRPGLIGPLPGRLLSALALGDAPGRLRLEVAADEVTVTAGLLDADDADDAAGATVPITRPPITRPGLQLTATANLTAPRPGAWLPDAAETGPATGPIPTVVEFGPLAARDAAQDLRSLTADAPLTPLWVAADAAGLWAVRPGATVWRALPGEPVVADATAATVAVCAEELAGLLAQAGHSGGAFGGGKIRLELCPTEPWPLAVVFGADHEVLLRARTGVAPPATPPPAARRPAGARLAEALTEPDASLHNTPAKGGSG